MIGVDELKLALRIRNDIEDTYIRSLESAAIAMIEHETGLYYGEPKDVTEIVNASGTVWLLSDPIEITSIESGTDNVWSDVTDYEANGRRIVLPSLSIYATSLRIEYSTGYDPEDVPADVRLKVMQLVTLWYERRLPDNDMLAMQQAVIGFNPTV